MFSLNNLLSYSEERAGVAGRKSRLVSLGTEGQCKHPKNSVFRALFTITPGPEVTLADGSLALQAFMLASGTGKLQEQLPLFMAYFPNPSC